MLSDYLRASEEMRQALAERDIGTVFELLNKRGGVSLRALGAAVGMTGSRVLEIVNGDRRVEKLEVFERIADALRVPGLQLGLAPRPWESHEQAPLESAGDRRTTLAASVADAGLPWSWELAPTVEAVYGITRSDLMLDRRSALRTMAVTVGMPLIDPVQRWLTGPDSFQPVRGRRMGRIGEVDVTRLESAARVFRNWDDSFGGGLARKAVIGQLNEVADMLRDSHPETIRKRLFHVMAVLAKIAATMSWDCGMPASAQKYYVLALQAAKPTGDRPFGASVLASMARQLLNMGGPRNRATDALELIRLAQDGSRDHGIARLTAMLHTREAWCYAELGRTEAFRRATGQAEDAFAHAGSTEEDPYWISYFDAAELAGVTGGRALDLARQDPRYASEAEASIERAIALRKAGSLRSAALDQSGLAQVHFLRGDVEQAVHVGHAAINAALRTQSDRVRASLRTLHATSTNLRHQPQVAELRERLHEALAS
ncbi:helix-turn-helix transcriptional regulator [Catenulispora yoronensis]|uniref:helix-turn-helix domain-containing protein n=1 Tax=Catenulispora yoronensis TaxID=450799 RepID=UPI0031D9433E